MNLVFVSGLIYPFEGAAANRYIAYSKGLTELGHKVTFVLILNQPEISGKFSIKVLISYVVSLKVRIMKGK